MPATHFSFNTLGVLAANGSSATGGCSSIQLNRDRRSTCLSPNSSVLFDGVIPTLTALDGNTWANQLMILYRPWFGYNNFIIDTATSGTTIGRVEVTIFNCPQWGTGVYRLTIQQYNTISSAYETIAAVHPSVLSCDSLLRVCVMVNTSSTQLSLTFNRFRSIRYVHISEVAFYESSSPCPLFTTIPGNWSAPATQGIIFFAEFAAIMNLRLHALFSRFRVTFHGLY